MNEHANRSTVGGRTTRNFHSVMDVIFKGMAVEQAGNDCQVKKVPLKVGYRWIVVDIVCPLLFVIHDGKQGDQLCCRANGHHRSERRHHQSCDCQFDDLDNPDVQCTFLTTDVITDLCHNTDDDVLNNPTLYRVDNAFNRIQMGKTLMASSCVQLLMSCTLYSMMVSLCTQWKHSGGFSTRPRSFKCSTGWRWHSTRPAVKASDHLSPAPIFPVV